jgi:hypothetical protein
VGLIQVRWSRSINPHRATITLWGLREWRRKSKSWKRQWSLPREDNRARALSVDIDSACVPLEIARPNRLNKSARPREPRDQVCLRWRANRSARRQTLPSADQTDIEDSCEHFKAELGKNRRLLRLNLGAVYSVPQHGKLVSDTQVNGIAHSRAHRVAGP